MNITCSDCIGSLMSFIILASKRWRHLKLLELCYFGSFFQRYVPNLMTSLEFVSGI